VVSFDGAQPYRELWDLQRRLWRQRVLGTIPDTLCLLEHAPVITLGKSARREHLILDTALLRSRGIEVAEVDRGGDVTYHGPGQLVGYWIFDLKSLYQDVHRFMREIEEVLIRVLARHGVRAGRDPKATGVWIGQEKIAAMGLHLSHWVSTHGFALNLTTDLTPFSWIVPCGLHGRGVTSLERQLRARGGEERVEIGRKRIEAELVEEIASLFGRRATSLAPWELYDCLMALERPA